MSEATFWRCVEATGVCEGLHVRADRNIVHISAGTGYHEGRPVRGSWRLNLSGQRGWRFVQVAPGGACAHATAFEEALPLAVVRVEHEQVVAMRDVRPRLYMWRWLRGDGALLFAPQGREVITRVQGAAQVGGVWETARAFVPWTVGSVLEPGEVTQAHIAFDKPAPTTGVMIETVGMTM